MIGLWIDNWFSMTLAANVKIIARSIISGDIRVTTIHNLGFFGIKTKIQPVTRLPTT